MKVNIILFALFLLFVAPKMSISKELFYPVTEIPEELLKDAQIVIRESSEKLEISSDNDARLTVHKVYTVLNSNGNEDVNLIIYYDKYRKVQDLSATVYDKNGVNIKKVKNDEILDYSAISGFSIYEDNRVKYIDPGEFEYPYTVEYTYEINIRDPFIYPSWTPIENYYTSVQHAVYSVTAPDKTKFRYYESNLPCECKKEAVNGSTQYKWETNNLTVQKPEDFSLPYRSVFPLLITAPTFFEIDNYKGSLESWNSFGKWVQSLNLDRQELSDETITKIKHLIRNATTDKEKVEILYKLLQDNSRYVSIQIGIGGWQSMYAKDVDRLAYGDCKALSNYMIAMLNVAGIESYYTLVNSGQNAPSIIKEFISPQFNHIIVCVPLSSDTLWLECTSQNNPCGYLSTFTDDREVLLIKPDGGQLVHTKIYSGYDNVKITSAKVNLTLEENPTAEIFTTYNGVFYNEVEDILRSDAQDQKKKMYNKYDIAGFNINKFSHREYKSQLPKIEETVNMELRNIYQKMGNRLIFNPNLLNKETIQPEKTENRLSDIMIRRSLSTIDTIKYEIPEGYQASNLPEKIEVNSDFGTYTAEFILNNSTLSYIRHKKVNTGIYPKEKYNDLIAFYDALRKADNIKIALSLVGT